MDIYSSCSTHLLIKNIQEGTSEKDLTELFGKFGKVNLFIFNSVKRYIKIGYETQEQTRKLLLAYKEFVINPVSSKHKFYNTNSTISFTIDLWNDFYQEGKTTYMKLYIGDIIPEDLTYSDINSYFEQYGDVISISVLFPYKKKGNEQNKTSYLFVTVERNEKTLLLINSNVRIKKTLVYISLSHGNDNITTSEYREKILEEAEEIRRSNRRRIESPERFRERRRSRSREESSREGRRRRRRTRSRSREERRSGRRRTRSRSRESRRSRRSRSRSTDSSSSFSSYSSSINKTRNNNNTTTNKSKIPDLVSMENNTISCHDDFLKWKDQFEELKPLYLNRIYFSSLFPPYPISPSFVSLDQGNEATISIPPILPHMTM